MLEYIKYRRNLVKLIGQVAKIENEYGRLKKEVKGDAWQQLHAEEGDEILPIYEEIDAVKTRYFCYLSNKFLVPLPESREEFWKNRSYGYGRSLTAKGIWEIKKLIREEKTERRSARNAFLAWIPALTGIIGTIIGLISILKK